MSTKITPQLRFPEFTDEWQVEKLGDVLSIGSGRDYKHLKDGNIPVYGTGGLMTHVNDYLYDGKSVAIGRKGTIDQPQFLKGQFWTVDTLFYTHDYKNSVPEFIFLLFQNINWKKWNEASGVPSLSSSTIKSIKVNIPSKPEQEKIADFLTAVDERIAVGEKKLELLETYKRGVMQKIFSQKVRFKDENGSPYPDWKEKAVSEFLKERKEYTSKGGDLEHISLTTAGVVPKSERYERDFLVRSTDKQYRITRLDDICYNPANLKFGVIARNKYKDGIFSPIYVTYVVNNADIGFVEYLVTSRDFIQRARKYEQGTVYERMAVSPQDLAKLKVRMPVIEEQQKIATFLATLDDKIKAEQTRLTAAKRWKKGLLQRMFV